MGRDSNSAPLDPGDFFPSLEPEPMTFEDIVSELKGAAKKKR